MATLMQRIQSFLRSPKGQKLISQGQQQLAKPENQQAFGDVIATLATRPALACLRR